MKKAPILLILFLISQYIYSQKLEDCSSCHVKKYSQSDIKENELYEISLLRNEIFARHHFSFKNERLNETFSKFEWYNPNFDVKSNEINLNSIELSNIIVFKTKENIIIQKRKKIIQELEKLKNIVNQTDDINTSSILDLNNIIDIDDPIYPAILGVIKHVLNSVDIKNIGWHKGKAQYEIRIDNGFSISITGIYLKKNEITILSSDPMKHSDIMEDDAFDYPSEYYSESEQTSGVEIEYINGKFVLKNIMFAG